MNLYHYIANNNSTGANELLNNYGFAPTQDLDTLTERLKMIVRKYKKIALKDLTLIHPDKNLLEMFTTSSFDDKDFAYATGRTPGFVEPEVEVVEAPTFPIEVPEPFESPTPDNTLDTAKVVDEIKAVKKQIVKDKINRERSQLNERNERNNRLLNMNNISANQKHLFMVGIAFVLGYLIGKR